VTCKGAAEYEKSIVRSYDPALVVPVGAVLAGAPPDRMSIVVFALISRIRCRGLIQTVIVVGASGGVTV
jgi:hypothetical protein